MADARAGVGIVVAERSANHFLDEIGLLVRAARRSDAADGVAAVLGLDALEFAGGVADGFFPADFAPRIGEFRANHGLQDAVLVRRIAPGEASLHAGMTVIGLAVFIGSHADDFGAAEFGNKRAAHAAVGASRNHAAVRLAAIHDRFFEKAARRAGLHAGAAGDTFGIEERFVAGGNGGCETAAINRQSKCSLNFIASADAARAQDALRGIEGKIWIGFVLIRALMILTGISVAHLAQAHGR